MSFSPSLCFANDALKVRLDGVLAFLVQSTDIIDLTFVHGLWQFLRAKGAHRLLRGFQSVLDVIMDLRPMTSNEQIASSASVTMFCSLCSILF